MYWYNLIIFLLICYGATNIVAEGKPFKPVRNLAKEIHPTLHELITCFMCLGFWIGSIISIIYFSPSFNMSYPLLEIITTPKTLIPYSIHVIFDGAISSGFCWVMYILEQKLTENIEL